MTIASSFAKDLESSLEQLEFDEWAVTSLRERVIAKLNSAEALDGIVEVLQLAADQVDAYAFMSCCWLALSLANLSNTTQIPSGLVEALAQIEALSRQFESESAVNEIRAWYRLAS